MEKGFVIFDRNCDLNFDWRACGQSLPAGATPVYAEDEKGKGVALHSYPNEIGADIEHQAAEAREHLAAFYSS